MKYKSVALLLGYNQVFFHPEVLEFLPINFPYNVSISGKPHLFHGKDLIVKSSIFVCKTLRTEKQGGSKLMFIQFEIVSICVWL